MKIKLFFSILICIIMVSCFKVKQEATEWTEIVTLQVSSETSHFYSFGSNPDRIEGMKIKQKNEDTWLVVHFQSIVGFQYIKGNYYELMVEITHLVNPPMDGSNVRYKLIKIL